MNTTTQYLIPMNRFRFVRSIKSHDDAFWAEKIFNQIEFSEAQFHDLARLHRYATTLHRLDENSCNGWPRPTTEIRDGKMYRFDKEDLAWKARDEKKEETIRQNVETIAKNHGWTIEHQSDPRGWPMKLTVNGIDCSILVNH